MHNAYYTHHLTVAAANTNQLADTALGVFTLTNSTSEMK